MALSVLFLLAGVVAGEETSPIHFSIRELGFKFTQEEPLTELGGDDYQQWIEGETANLVTDGIVQEPFKCAEGGVDKLTYDVGELDVRPLLVTTPTRHGLLDGLVDFGAGDGADLQEDAGEELDDQLQVLTIMDVKHVALDPVTGQPSSVVSVGTEHDDPLDDGAGEVTHQFSPSMPLELLLLYGCKGTGTAVIKTTFSVLSPDIDSTANVCLRWKKRCVTGLRKFQVRTIGSLTPIVEGHTVNRAAEFFARPVGPDEVRTEFLFSAVGVLLLKDPLLVSATPSVAKATLAGRGAASGNLQVSALEAVVAVEYTCLAKGSTEFTMPLERGVSDQGSATAEDRVELKWTKQCNGADDTSGSRAMLDAHIVSATYGNKTKAVGRGVVLPGFRHPCRPRARAAATQAAAKRRLRLLPGVAAAAAAMERRRRLQEGAVVPGSRACVNELPILTIPRRDPTTVIEVTSSGPVDFSANAVLSFNTHKLRAYIAKEFNAGTRTGAGGGTMITRATVRYVCYRDGEANITMTLFPTDARSVDFSWKKRCKQPKTAAGKSPVTVGQVSLVIGGLVLMGCAVACVLYRMFTGKVDKVAAGKAAQLAGMVGRAGGGAAAGGSDGEAVFHQ